MGKAQTNKRLLCPVLNSSNHLPVSNSETSTIDFGKLTTVPTTEMCVQVEKQEPEWGTACQALCPHISTALQQPCRGGLYIGGCCQVPRLGNNHMGILFLEVGLEGEVRAVGQCTEGTRGKG